MFRKVWMRWTRSERVAVPVIIGAAVVLLLTGLHAVMMARTGGWA